MKKRHSPHLTEKAPLAPVPPRTSPEPPAPSVEGGGFAQGWARFWFSPTDPIGLHVVRVLAGLLFLAWLLPLAGQLDAFFGLDGWFGLRAYREVPQLPERAMPVPLGWSLLYLAGTSSAALHAIYWGSILILALFTLGLAPRVTAVLTWVVVISFQANPALTFDAEALLVILAFYLMIGYLLLGLRRPGLSPLERLLGPSSVLLFRRRSEGENEQSVGANLALRLLQIHFALVIVTSGLHKLQVADWWSGSALWFPLFPAMETTLEEARSLSGWALPFTLGVLLVVSLLLAWRLLYPLLALAAGSRRGGALAAGITAVALAGGVYLLGTGSPRFLPWFFLGVLSLATYLVLAWQLGFPFYAWRPGAWRVVLIGGAALGWLFTSLIHQLPIFGPAFFIAALCYVSAAEWRRWLAWLPRVPGLQKLARWLPAPHHSGQLHLERKEAVTLAAGRSQ
ncbi:MAG: hypothetical protein L0Z62_41415 [Gemmataceae bacterium]|nr:hypothetical protein [Gemmataceae bacterium]